MADTVALVDGSVYSKSVCDHVAWYASRTSGSVELLHVLGSRQGVPAEQNLSGSIGLGARTQLLKELAEIDGQKAKLQQKFGRAILDEVEEHLKSAGVTEVSNKLRKGDIVETLLESEANAELVAIGKRGESADFAKQHLGSNLERIVRSSSKPVLVASRAFQPVERVLLAFDGGVSAMKAAEHMGKSPAFKGLDVHILSVGNEDPARVAELAGVASLLRGNDCQVTTEIKAGQPDTVITEKVDSGDFHMLTMGAYGHSRIRNLIIGSTTTVMIRSCKIPVMLFR